MLPINKKETINSLSKYNNKKPNIKTFLLALLGLLLDLLIYLLHKHYSPVNQAFDIMTVVVQARMSILLC